MTSSFVDIIICNVKTSITPKQYTVAVENNIYFEVSYSTMLVNYIARQDTLSLAHILHVKGKSKVKQNHQIKITFAKIYFYFRM